MMHYFIKAINFIRWFFTHSPCLNCGKIHDNKEMYHVCEQCVLDLDSILNDEKRCPKCRRSTPCTICTYDSWASATAFFSYQNEISKNLLYLYKTKNSILAEKDICTLLEPYLKEYSQEILIPIPCNVNTLKILGFNPVERILDRLNIPYYNILSKKPVKFSQKELSGTARKMQPNFIELKTNIPSHIKNKKIFLIDDVITTGTTINHAITTLRQHGLKNIHVIGLFRD